MGYVEGILGEKEHVIYSTHLHLVVLLQRLIGSLFAFAVFLALGLAVILPPNVESGNRVRLTIGVIALGTVVMPLYLIVSAWVRGLRGRDFAWRVWRAALAGILILAVSLILMLKPEFKPIGWIALVIAVIPCVELVRIFLDWTNERYIITNRRVMEVKGIINKHVRDSALEKVNDVDLRQSVVGRMLGYGTVQIITGSDIGVNMFRRISNPVRLKREMLNAKERLHSIEPASQPKGDTSLASSIASAEADIPDLLVELHELRQKGVLSEEEFRVKKEELLKRL